MRFRFISSDHHHHHHLYQTFISTDIRIVVLHVHTKSGCETRNCQMFGYNNNTLTLLIISRIQMELNKPHSYCSCWFFAICWCRWQCSIFCLLLLPLLVLALCKCENLQLDLGLQGPKWIFIIYQQTQASKQASIYLFNFNVPFVMCSVFSHGRLYWPNCTFYGYVFCFVFATFFYLCFCFSFYLVWFGLQKHKMLKIQPYDSENW